MASIYCDIKSLFRKYASAFKILKIHGEETELVFADVARHIETNLLLAEGLNVLEFSYNYDLVGRDKPLQKYIDIIKF